MSCPKHPGWLHDRTDCPLCALDDNAIDYADSLRRAELANSYANTDVDTLLRDINLLTQIAMFKLHMERLQQQRKAPDVG